MTELERLIELVRQLPEPTEAERRDQAISWVWGNLACSTNHKVDRSVVEAAYDKLHPPTKESK